MEKTEKSEDPDILKIYVTESKNTSSKNAFLLTKEEEIELAKKKDRGDKEALKKLICANLGFVVSIAKKYRRNRLSLNDLIQEGNIGLMKAAEKYDYRKEVRFITYASWWINQSIRQAIAEYSNPRLPIGQFHNIGKIEREEDSFYTENGRYPSLKEISKKTGISLENINRLLRFFERSGSLDTGINDEGFSLISIIKDNRYDIERELTCINSLKEDVNDFLQSLPKRERGILEQRFGLNGFSPSTLEELSLKYNRTRERIRQIQERALEKLRNHEHIETLREYLELQR